MIQSTKMTRIAHTSILAGIDKWLSENILSESEKLDVMMALLASVKLRLEEQRRKVAGGKQPRRQKPRWGEKE